MSIVRRFVSLALVALPLLLLQACEENPVTSTDGSGTLLQATVDGVQLTIPITLATYDTTINRVTFGGSVSSAPTKTVTVFFSFDIDKGTYPSTLDGTNANLNYVESTSSSTDVYDCDATAANCSVTVKSHNGDIVDGTFEGDLVKTDDASKKITISDGKFSVKLTRVN
jgi:hypothetical protein